MNAYQKLVCEKYGGGDYAHLADQDEFDVEDSGDTLFDFLMIELADKEDCDDLDEAVRRVQSAIDQLIEVREALEQSEK